MANVRNTAILTMIISLALVPAIAWPAGGGAKPLPAVNRTASGDAPTGDVVGRIQRTYESMQSFQVDFVQELRNSASGQTQTRSGSISYKQPGLVRWETREPEPELLIVGLDYVWDYFAGEELALKYRVAQMFDSKTMLRFISGKARLDEDFQIAEKKLPNGYVELQLTPLEPEPGLVAATVIADDKSGWLQTVEVIDFYGNSNKLTFKDVRIDPNLPPSLFQFTPPAGVDVQDNTHSS